MVRVATRIGSTECRPSQQRWMARTILFRSTGSVLPLRLVTLMAVAVGGGVSSKPASAGATSVAEVVTTVCPSWRGARKPLPSQETGAGGGIRSMEGRRRSNRDASDHRSASTAPRRQPSSPRRHRSRHRAVCFARLSAGLRTHGHEGGGLLLLRRFPRSEPQCIDGVVPIYRCGAVLEWPTRRHQLPFQSGERKPTRTDEPQDSGGR
ncbi:hypothetical protein D3C71_1472940 [compost metagenome]